MNWGNKGYLVLSALNVKDGYIDKSIEAKYGCQELFDKWMGGNSLRKNDVVFTTEAPLGNVAQIPDNNGYILNQRVVAFKTSPNAMDNNFLAQFLRSPLFQNKLNANASGGTAKGIGMKEFAKLSLYLPKDINEQRKIGTFLKTMDNTIALHQRKLDALKQMKKGFLQQLFPENGEKLPRVRFTGFEGEWEQRRLGDYAEILTGGTPKTSISEYWEPKKIPWMSSGEVNKRRLDGTDNMISEEGLNNSSARWVKAHSVLIALAGQGKTRGTVAVNNIRLTTNQSIAAIVPKDNLHYEFVYQNLLKRYDELRMFSSGDGTRGGLNKQIVSDVVIPSPSKEEQFKIGAFFKQLDNTITLYQYKIDQLNILKKSCLQNMFI
ncbi:restriction endonuclease subunit S [Listeria booriae]|nr:restriction endonuclease subunit S [Listeria booriae]